jgi:hypothetical protein
MPSFNIKYERYKDGKKVGESMMNMKADNASDAKQRVRSVHATYTLKIISCVKIRD